MVVVRKSTKLQPIASCFFMFPSVAFTEYEFIPTKGGSTYFEVGMEHMQRSINHIARKYDRIGMANADE